MKITKRLLASRSFWWLVLTVACGIGALLMFDIPRYYALASRGIQTQAEVVSKDPENHRIIHYAYTIDGKKYIWGGYSGDIKRDFDDVKIGEVVSCVYDPLKPSSSTMGDPFPQLMSLIYGAIFVTLIPTMLWLSYIAQRAVRKHQAP